MPRVEVDQQRLCHRDRHQSSLLQRLEPQRFVMQGTNWAGGARRETTVHERETLKNATRDSDQFHRAEGHFARMRAVVKINGFYGNCKFFGQNTCRSFTMVAVRREIQVRRRKT
jgi:hypothetical protein